MAPATSAQAAAAHEQRRLSALRDYAILDTPREGLFDDFTRIAAAVCKTPIAVVNLIDAERQWFKSEIGLGVRETPLDTSICAHAILQHDLFVVPDTQNDHRFVNNPLVTGDPGLRFYAGALLKTTDGLAIGTMCVLDTQPRELDEEQLGVLQALSRQVMVQLELRKTLRDAERTSHYRARLMAIMGHDLKSPLRTAMYALGKVRGDVPPAHHARLDTVTQSLEQIDRDFTRLIATGGGRDTYTANGVETIALAPFLDAVATPFRTLAARKGLQLRVAPTSLVVSSHATMLGTLIGNLIGNAVKYTERGGVLVGCRRRGDSVSIEVLDTGVGMPVEAVELLFEAFNQADSGADGMGLGLWIVRQTAETLGHPIDVRSRVGRGTHLRVTVPRVVEGAA